MFLNDKIMYPNVFKPDYFEAGQRWGTASSAGDI